MHHSVYSSPRLFWPTPSNVYHSHLGTETTPNNVFTFEPAETPSDDVASPVDPSFAGFGIETSNLFSFTGAEHPNNLTLNLLNNLANYTGNPPHIRIGGNTQDYMLFHEDQDAWAWTQNAPGSAVDSHSRASSMLIGPRFLETANRLPKGTPVTWGLNMAYELSDFNDQVALVASKVLSSCPNLNITSFEIGNEPDLYYKYGLRTGEWGGKVYTEQWIDRATTIWERVLQPMGYPSNFFEAGSTASTIGTDFEIKDLVSFNISQNASQGSSKPYLSSWNQHDYYYYIGVTDTPLTLEILMQWQTTEDQLTAWLDQVSQAAQTPYPYQLREMGIVGPIGLENVTDTFGAALWTLNFLLYSASNGIASVGLHMTDNSAASAWQPIAMGGQPPHVRPVYYGIAAFDQVIGRSRAAQVARLDSSSDLSADYRDSLRAYSVYQAGELATVVVVNGRMFNVSFATPAPRDKPSVQLKLPAKFAGRNVYLSYLTGPGADAKNGTTWSGTSFDRTGDGKPTQVSNGTETAVVDKSGIVKFRIRDSEAVVASIGGIASSTGAPESTSSSLPATASPTSSSSTTPAAASAAVVSSGTPSPDSSASTLRISSALTSGLTMLYIVMTAF
ncbi:hypothetical protein GGS23DRAFT_620253 [Durotheca rogersii]|uniref:uncharacterized protein n=1 Tax=Durotheca rogersii TaxID=419775 RepID=UPI00221E913B|nr:uncharacterized protein GGS23DRAFT_620253 [Durotheca rogersii]KAI5864438.1 hypothetical protein GGS23DRAFT_620253 [Durotheca rogersii]